MLLYKKLLLMTFGTTYVNVVVLLQFVLMETCKFAVQVEPTIFLETSPI